MIDLVVVGGGPVGLVTALAARRRGLAVTVLDQRKPPIDKACGEGLMPEGRAVLARLGVAGVTGAQFGGIRYVDGELEAEGRFPAGVHGLGVRRTVLHEALAAGAVAAGVDLRWGVAARGIEDGAVLSSEGRLAPRWIAAADGLHSPSRKWIGVRVRRGRMRRFGLRRHYRVAPWSDCVEVHWAEGSEAYVTPVGANEVGVAVLWSGDGSGFDRRLASFPALVRRVGGAEVVSSDRGSGPFWQRPERLVRGNVALVGDAAGYLDAITGEGLALGFRQAELLTERLAAGDLEGYERASRRLVAWPFLLIRALLVAERRPRLRRRLVAALASEGDLFSVFLASLVESHRPSIATAARLVRAIASA